MTLFSSHAWSTCGLLFGGCLTTLRKPALFRVNRPRYASRQDDALFQAVQRALGSSDLDYVASLPVETRDLRRYLRASRRTFVRFYLHQTRHSFLASARVAREFAADSDAPELAFAVLRQTLRFHCLWAALQLSLFLSFVGPTWRLTEALIRAIRPGASSGSPEAARSRGF